MSNAFPAAFIEPLLRMSLSRDAATRRIVQEILHTLLDRHNNLDKLKTVRFALSPMSGSVSVAYIVDQCALS